MSGVSIYDVPSLREALCAAGGKANPIASRPPEDLVSGWQGVRGGGAPADLPARPQLLCQGAGETGCSWVSLLALAPHKSCTWLAWVDSGAQPGAFTRLCLQVTTSQALCRCHPQTACRSLMLVLDAKPKKNHQIVFF